NVKPAPEPAKADAPAPQPVAVAAVAAAAAQPAEKPLAPPTAVQADPAAASASDEIQLSFQGANIEMVVQWLAKATGKSVVKHPRVQCQLTIVSSKKLQSREAINLVYRALALEGFTTIESSKSILIVPEGQEPKISPELVDGSRTEMPEGRQRLIKIFPLKNVQAAELVPKIRAVLSEKGTIEVTDRANQIIVTDYTDNIRLLGELIKELDVASAGDSVIEFYSLKHSDAEELGNLLTLILNAQPAPPPSLRPPPQASRSSSSSRSDGPSFGGAP